MSGNADSTPSRELDSPRIADHHRKEHLSEWLLTYACKLAMFLALFTLAVRASVRLEDRWDTFMYHIPFAARYGRLNIPYEMNERMLVLFDGFPPLPHLVQGLFWKLSNSLNATGIVNYLAFSLFLVYCHRILRAPAWLVALISISAPLVIIQMTASYIDLFGNSFLAIGVCSCLHIWLFPEHRSRGRLIGGLLGATAAAWSKYQLVPIASLVFLFLSATALWSPQRFKEFTRRGVVAWIVATAALAAAPYGKNFVTYGNPFWPIKVPVIGDLLPNQVSLDGANDQRPPPLKEASQFSVFFHSLLEINHPTRYPHRARWIIDQGNAWIAFRSGGFWAVGTVFYLLTLGALLTLKSRSRGLAALAGIFGLICVVGLLPQSHELRYYLFLPLMWAGGIGMLFPDFKREIPTLVPAFLVMVLSMFGYMVWENLVHYRIERKGYREAADSWGASQWWSRLKQGERYCAVDMVPVGILLTGPTMTEFTIIDRSRAYLCPFPSTLIYRNGSEVPMSAEHLVNESLDLFRQGHFQESLNAATRARELKPDSAAAYNNACAANIGLKRWQAAIDDCSAAVAIAPDFQLAKNNLAWAIQQASEQPH